MKACRLVEWVLLFTLFGSSSGSKACCRALKEKKIVPNYAERVKSTNVKVRCDDKVVQCGGKVLVTKTVFPPIVRFDVCNQCENVTLLAFSPDNLVGPPNIRWLVINIPASEIKKGFNGGGPVGNEGKPGDVKAAYTQPKDPGVGDNRENKFVIFIYCQSHYIADKKFLLKTERFQFDIKGFAKKNDLKCPVAGFFYLVTVNPVKIPLNPPPVPVPTPTVSGLNSPVQPPL